VAIFATSPAALLLPVAIWAIETILACVVGF
jgi:hypothetical protein